MAFEVEYGEKDLGYKTGDLLTTRNYFNYKDKLWEIVDKFELQINKENFITIHEFEISIPCEVDLSNPVGEIGYPEPLLERV